MSLVYQVDTPLKKKQLQTRPVEYPREAQKQVVTQTEFLEMNQDLHQLVTTKTEDMKQVLHTSLRAVQQSINKQHQQQQRILQSNERLQQQLHETNERLQQQLHESTERQQQQLQELQVAVEGVRQDNQQIREITIRSEEMEVTIQQLNEEIQHLRIQADNPQWVIEREEIQMTQEVVGRGGWGEVKVGVFRGTRVAVKCLYELILSQYNLELFSREMDIASRVRHPNLLQFIGATRVGNPMIVAELMPTSLRKEMDKNPLTRLQILGISRDVASALNYLHLWRPEPILHRDVGSPNILLEPSGHNQWKGKLSDYGSANIQHQISSTVGPGNPAYAAPESRYPNDHSPAMDVYSFGVLLMEMVVHRPPSPTTREKDALIRTIQWAPMKALIQSCTQEAKEQRPTTSNVLEELCRHL